MLCFIMCFQEEVKCEQRRRNLLVLILHYLHEEGYLNSVALASLHCSHKVWEGMHSNSFIVCNIEGVKVQSAAPPPITHSTYYSY